MKSKRMVRALDIHVAGWPLRVLFDFTREVERETLIQKANRLWNDTCSSVRWVQREPRGHAALRVGVIAASSNADFVLIVFDAEGPCLPDEMDALCAAEALTETGAIGMTESIALETVRGIMQVSAADDQLRSRKIGSRLTWQLGKSIMTSPLDTSNCRYTVIDASNSGMILRAENAAKLEPLMQHDTEHEKKVFFVQENDGEKKNMIAVIGRDGKLLRAPDGNSVGAVLATIYDRDPEGEMPIRFHGLSCGMVEGSIHTVQIGQEGMLEIAWELRARARIVASCEFVSDPADPLDEGFLLR